MGGAKIKGLIHRRLGHVLRGSEGFTLIEMMVVLAIIAVLATIVAPRLVGFLDVAEAGAQQAERESVKIALQVMMAEQRVFTMTSRSGSTSVNDWSTLPSGAGTTPLSSYLESPQTTYFYCYDSLGNITRQDTVATPACP